MNAAEKIVEAYLREVKGLFTQTSIKGEQQSELDIVAVDPKYKPPLFYHVESTVSISSAYSSITNKPFNADELRKKEKTAGQRRTVGFIVNNKFYSPEIRKTLENMGCNIDCLKRILISWEFDQDAKKELENNGIECLSMKKVLQDLANHLAKETHDYDSDILRTIQLFVRSKPDMPEILSVQSTRKKKKKEKG